MNGHKVKDWMTTDTITIPSRGTLPEAYWLMIKHNIRRLPVVDNDVLVGIVTLEDLRRAKSARTVGLDMIRISDMLAKSSHPPDNGQGTHNDKTYRHFAGYRCHDAGA